LDGILINGAPGNTVGGSAAGQGNLISGNHLTGIRLSGGSAAGNVISGNRIGTDLSGRRPVGNTFDRIFDTRPPGHTIGGTGTLERNLISGNGGVGVQIYSRDASGNQVLANLIGTDADGTGPLGNGHNGVFINDAPGNTIGGTADGARNVISANA